MVIPDKDVAVMLMLFALLGALVLTANIAPRRTPANNYLDYEISSTQMLILSIGGMSVYEGLRSDALAWVVMLLIILVFAISGILILIKGCQWLSRNRSPFSWCFDVFLDHHGGVGANACRVLAFMFQGMVRPNKFFFDADVFYVGRAAGSLAVIMDAAKLTKHMVVALGNETWCRTWCVGAICSTVQKKIPMSVVACGSQDEAQEDMMQTLSGGDLSEGTKIEANQMDGFMAVLSKQVPKLEIRALGCDDAWIPVAIQQVMQNKARVCALSTRESFNRFAESLVKDMSSVLFVQSAASVSARLFSERTEKGYDDGKYTLISSDHGDPEALAASRVIFMIINNIRNERQAMSGIDRQAVERGTALFIDEPVLDVDVDATTFSDLILKDKISAFLFLVTNSTFKNTQQLIRLGYAVEKSTKIRPVPICINDVFRFPDVGILQMTGADEAASTRASRRPVELLMDDALKYTTSEVQPSTVRKAVFFVLQHRMFLCNIPRESASNIQIRVQTMLQNIATGLENVPRPDFSAAEPTDKPKYDAMNEKAPVQAAVEAPEVMV
jgi:hypothetical protein